MVPCMRTQTGGAGEFVSRFIEQELQTATGL